jgi:TolB-like protein/Tfp pilus assembly protein PilF
VNDKEHPARATAVGMDRKLTAILAADVKGYSRLMGEDEVGTLRTLTAYRKIIDTLIEQYHGRIVGTAGDSVLAEFASVVDAVQCAVVIQTTLKTENASRPNDRRMEFRIGINLGDVMVEGEQIYGDGVNIAARLEALAEGGGICISGTVYEQIENKLPLKYEDLGEQTVKNIKKPVRVYRVGLEVPAPPVGQASSLLTARMAVPPEGSSKFQVPGSTLKEEGPQPRRVGAAHLSRSTFVMVGLLIVGALAALLYSSLSPIRLPQSAIRNQEALPLPDKPSLVVLPFTNISSDPEQEYFSDGITEDITTDLAKVSSLFVISRNSAFTYKGKAVKLPEVSRELGVRYVIEGSVRKAGDQVRITTQLIDAMQDQHLWSERYDRPLKDIFAVQDEIRQKIVFALKVKLTPEEQERFRQFPTANLEAYDYFLRGREASDRAWYEYRKEANTQAQQMFEKAIELDPQYAAAYAGLGSAYWLEFFFRWTQDPPQSLRRAFELTQRAVALDDSLPGAHRMLGNVYLFQRQHELAIAEIERAIYLNPSNALNYSNLGVTLVFAGRLDEGVKALEQGLRLDPRNPTLYLIQLGHAYRSAGQCEKAIVPIKQALSLNPAIIPARANLAVCYVELGREDEARAEAAEVLRRNPSFSVETAWRKENQPFKDPAPILERLYAAARKAGLQ